MPFGEAIAEFVIRPILEVAAYWTGYLVLKAITLGSVSIAPLLTLNEKNRGKRKWHQIDWSIWLRRPMQRKALKAEISMIAGFLVWLAIALGAYLVMRDPGKEAEQAMVADRDNTSNKLRSGCTRRGPLCI